MSSLVKARVAKVTIWIVAEVLLNLLNLDTMADYSEFIFGQEVAAFHTAQPAIALCV